MIYNGIRYPPWFHVFLNQGWPWPKFKRLSFQQRPTQVGTNISPRSTGRYFLRWPWLVGVGISRLAFSKTQMKGEGKGRQGAGKRILSFLDYRDIRRKYEVAFWQRLVRQIYLRTCVIDSRSVVLRTCRPEFLGCIKILKFWRKNSLSETLDPVYSEHLKCIFHFQGFLSCWGCWLGDLKPPTRNTRYVVGSENPNKNCCFLGGGFKYVLCSPLPGEDSHVDEHIFQMGWFNHQLVLFSWIFDFCNTDPWSLDPFFLVLVKLGFFRCSSLKYLDVPAWKGLEPPSWETSTQPRWNEWDRLFSMQNFMVWDMSAMSP